MSSSGSLSGITFGGLSSGIDTESIISRMGQLEAAPINRMTNQKNVLGQRQALMAQIASRLTQFSSAAGQLNTTLAFNPISASSSETDNATITAEAGSGAGTYELKISTLAKAHKISSSAQSSTSTALGLTGQFQIGGKRVNVEATDTLTLVAQKINSTGSAFTASIIDGGTSNGYLTLTSRSAGEANKVQASDVTGNVLSSLGLLSGSIGIRETITNGATSRAFDSTSSTVGAMMGFTGLTDQTIKVNGTDVTVNLQTMTLDQIATAINGASTGATAAVRTITKDGATTYKLDISGASTPTFTDAGGTLAALGVLQNGYSNSLINATDASYSIDGVAMTSSTNTVTGAIPGATITLLKADLTTPKTSTLTLSKDVSQVKSRIEKLVSAYNDTVGLIRQNSQFDKESFAAGPLFGDATARQIESTLASSLFSQPAGLTGTYTNATAIGLSLDKDGALNLDAAKLTKAITEKPNEVEALFRTIGTPTTSTISFVSTTNKTIPSGAVSYPIQITTVATKSSVVAGVAQANANTAAEKLTFAGTLFSSQNTTIDFAIGSTLADKVAAINSDAKLKDSVVASIEGGKLRLDSTRYGTPGTFSVTSSLEGTDSNSGIGIAGTSTTTNGVNVAGTIAGKAATGSGQFLTGSEDTLAANPAWGLQIQYTGASTGAVGSIQVTKGLGNTITDMLSTFTDTTNGLLKGTDDSLTAQIKTIDDNITRLNERVAQRQTELRLRFAKMEEAIARSQSQGQQLGALANSASR